MDVAPHFRSGFSSDNQQVSFSSAAQHSREHSGGVSDTEADIVKLRSVEQTHPAISYLRPDSYYQHEPVTLFITSSSLNHKS